ncbi:hypothetical protein [Allorhodopirellula solitaria]|nr:hypothetical protein [Allorhodopirellula solitaria]
MMKKSTSQPDAVAAVTARRRYWQRCALGIALGVTATGMTGCTMLGGLQKKIQHCDCIDDFMISHRNKVMATRAWFRVKPNYHGHCYLKDFRNGFIAGYIDVANGGAGCTPTVISSEYWGWRYQSGSGQAAVNAWYEGFPLGAKAAEEDGIGNYNTVRLNGMRPNNTNSMNMTGTASPTPAVTPIPPTGSGGLPPGVVLDEGETLVPGGVVIEDSHGGQPTLAEPPAQRSLENAPVEAAEEIPSPDPARSELDRAFDDAKPAAPQPLEIEPAEVPPVEIQVDPYTNDFGVDNRSSESSETKLTAQEKQFWNEISGGTGSTLTAKSTAEFDELELVPRDTTAVTSPSRNAPASDSIGDRPSAVSEPSQAEIDAVIEEIFGKQDSGSR